MLQITKIFSYYLPLFLTLLTASLPALASPIPTSTLILQGAQQEVKKATTYQTGYLSIPYPNGDVPPEIGVCTDLVIRAFRTASIDLQKLLHEDRTRNPNAYPTHLWSNKKPDHNIDHRRCQNLSVFFQRFATSLTTGTTAQDYLQYQPGDVVFFVREREKYPWHVAIISDKRTESGEPYILHLFPPEASEALLTDFTPVHSHFRWKESKKPQD